MQANTGFPHQLHWDSFQLADAVPRRLSELYRFDARLVDTTVRAGANGEPRRSRQAPPRYVPASSLPGLFRVD